MNWWERCSFEAFRDKFVREAEQNRAPEIRLGQEIANRTYLYFKENLTDWRPQKDCFYLDENIGGYLREVYEIVRLG